MQFHTSLIRSCLLAVFLSACSPSQEAYTAVEQIITDPIIYSLGNQYYLTKERDGDFYIIKLDADNEVTEMDKLF
jgi:hypothetical protein